MPRTKPKWPTLLLLLSLLASLGACATQTPIDVGAVVVAPQVQPNPLPEAVKVTKPKPAGYFQCSFLIYSVGSCERPTTSTSPTPPAGPTH